MDQMGPVIQMTTEFEIYTFWIHYLSLCLATILLIRFLGIVLPVVIPKIIACTLPSCRARRAVAKQLDSELRDLRLKMSKLNMVDNFAGYSKLQRRVKALERERDESDRSQLGISVSLVLLFFTFKRIKFSSLK